MYKKFLKIEAAISVVYKAVFSAVIPPLLLILAAKYIVSRFGFGGWLIALAAFVGIALGTFSMIYVIIKALRKSGGTDNDNKQ